jgi:hypothetical protein
MPRGIIIPIISTLLAGAAVAGDMPVVPPPSSTPAAAATQPAKPIEGYRHLDHGSWVITEARVRSNGTPTAIRRKVLITADATGRRAVEESRWHNDTFEPTGPAQPLAAPDRRSFDELGLKPQSTRPEEPLTLGRKRYLCTVATYVIKSDAGDRTTTLTLYRDNSGATHLPPRTLSVNNRELPLPADCLQVDFTVDGPTIATRGQRRIVSLSSPLRAGGQTCACLVEQTRSQGTSNDKPVALTLQEWFSHDLPGERLRTTTEMTAGPMQVASEVTVLDFHVAGKNPETARAVQSPAQ